MLSSWEGTGAAPALAEQEGPCSSLGALKALSCALQDLWQVLTAREGLRLTQGSPSASVEMH